MRRFSLKPSGLVGISIQPRNIHLVQLKKAKKSYLLERARQVPLPENVFREGKVREFTVLTEVLADLVQAEQLQAHQAAVCVSVNQVKMASMVMPAALSDEEVEAEIKAEVYRGLPGKSDALAVDFQRCVEKGAFEAPVFFAAVRHDYVAQYAACLRDAGLSLAVVDVDVFALLRAARHALRNVVTPPATMAALYFGHDYAVIAGQSESNIVFFQQWEGQLGSALAMTVLQWVEWCCQTYRHYRIESVAISGKPECVNQAAKMIGMHWQSKIYETDPFAHMMDALRFEKSNPAIPRSTFMLACGLAMRESLPWLK